jgi:large subunit ribosomal protein L13
MKTRRTKESEIERTWHLIDAADKPLGRLSSQTARLLMGKHKPHFEPFLDTGDFVVIINADKVHVQDKKLIQKLYYRYSGYPGGIKSLSLGEMLSKKPQDVIRYAVKGMLPKNRLGRKMIKKLKIYASESHPHGAQQPQVLEI